MTPRTRIQKLAEAAYGRVAQRANGDKMKPDKRFAEYASFAKKFPALIHTCGLAQAVAFGLAKQESSYIEDLACVLKDSGHPKAGSAEALRKQTHDQSVGGYLRLSRDAINAAAWLKRYVEALGEDD